MPAEPYIAEIIMFGGNFAPRGWALCDGQVLSIAQNQALFSLLGTTYGGNGTTTFALPDLRGRVPVHAGTGPGLSQQFLGSQGGTETTSLTAANLPAHAHDVTPPVTNGRRTTDRPAGASPARGGAYSSASPAESGASFSTSSVGGGQPVGVMQPYVALNFIIALEGIYPSRN